jgi:hypothetical protein
MSLSVLGRQPRKTTRHLTKLMGLSLSHQRHCNEAANDYKPCKSEAWTPARY